MSACARAKVLEHALEIATTDELTGALNRRGFYERFDAEIDRARRNQTSMCLVLLDLDHFKQVNDTYGHLVGDTVLQDVVRLILRNTRKSDLVCRYGGEEFALLLPETTLPFARDLVDRLRRKVAKHGFETPMGTFHVSFSAGIMPVETFQQLSKPADAVIADALTVVDKALYAAKQQGRNRIEVDTPGS